MNNSTQSKWIGGLAEWEVENTLYLSVAFTWKLNDGILEWML